MRGLVHPLPPEMRQFLSAPDYTDSVPNTHMGEREGGREGKGGEREGRERGRGGREGGGDSHYTQAL